MLKIKCPNCGMIHTKLISPNMGECWKCKNIHPYDENRVADVYQRIEGEHAILLVDGKEIGMPIEEYNSLLYNGGRHYIPHVDNLLIETVRSFRERYEILVKYNEFHPEEEPRDTDKGWKIL